MQIIRELAPLVAAVKPAETGRQKPPGKHPPCIDKVSERLFDYGACGKLSLNPEHPRHPLP